MGTPVEAYILEPHTGDSREGGDGRPNSEAASVDKMALWKRFGSACLSDSHSEQPGRTTAEV